MKIETIKLKPKKEVNACKIKEITVLKSIEFESLDYPEIELKDLHINEHPHNKGCDLYLNIRVEVSKEELFNLLGALKHNDELWREEDLPCNIKIGVNKKVNMDYFEEIKNK